MKRPSNYANLIKAINTFSKGKDPVRISRAMANVIVGQIYAVTVNGSDRCTTAMTG